MCNKRRRKSNYLVACRRTVLGLSLAVLLISCSRQQQLLDGVNGKDVHEIIGVLGARGISANMVKDKDGTYSIVVAPADKEASMRVLVDHGLPRPAFKSFGEVFSQDGLISSAAEERARFLFAVSQKLEYTLSNIDGVVFASVHPVLPERASLVTTGSPSSASVFIKHRPDANLSRLAPEIQRIVASAIPGLTPELVSVMLVTSQITWRPAAAPRELLDTVGWAQIALAMLGILLLAAIVAARFMPGALREKFQFDVTSLRALYERLEARRTSRKNAGMHANE